MPGQDRAWADQEFQAEALTLPQQANERGDHGSVAEFESRLRPAALQDTQLMAQHQDLDILGRGGPCQQAEPAEQEAAESVDQTERHDSQACVDGLANVRDVIPS
ncbi:hypothetical protein [Streptomyces sp. NPDC005507]|uniref:hypothetical protein n=1 Tax=unclassified Streptomyces TaxID=2593676 RepID=UPI0033A5C4D8